ncbi:hypothetical protein GMA12_12885 [Kocuria sediminis]|uniref:Uncharacterized protein n=2 Tax=Kocuria TaxID=57493 RepID=A0A512IC47_9MICC|nr:MULTISPECIES: hypothetical protein [Kocuria]MUN64023.1 hypothetical protein [Kocuria sediminis]GEO95280.1 hypothetical protein KTU01_14030 [Kocuria turfanensis]
MHENTALVPRPPWATAQEVTDPETVTNSRELPARSLAGPSPVALLETWEVVTTPDGSYAHPDGVVLHIGHEAWTVAQARVLRDRIDEALGLLE